MNLDVTFFRVRELPAFPVPNAVYYVKPKGAAFATEYVTNMQGVAYPVAPALGTIDLGTFE